MNPFDSYTYYAAIIAITLPSFTYTRTLTPGSGQMEPESSILIQPVDPLIELPPDDADEVPYCLSCLVQLYPVLSCPILSCLVLSCLVLSCPVLSCPLCLALF
jgi:hypothetical protein